MKRYVSFFDKKIYLLFVLGVLFLAACDAYTLQENDISEITEESMISQDMADKVEISMEEAIIIGADEAAHYYEDLMVTKVSSYDNDAYREIDAGSDGNRQWWYVDLSNKANNYVSVIIKDGKVWNVYCADENGGCKLINMEEVKMTSEQAAKSAIELGLLGGNPDIESQWVSGYNFDLSIASLTSAPNEYRIFLEVIGISSNGNFSHADFDATTGELLLLEEKIEYENGDFEWVCIK